jgi:hypothetical protein
MKKPVAIVLALLMLLLVSDGFSWGFFGHKSINRLAVFILPPEMFGFYKMHIEYITEHAVDPDKRRYRDPEEAPRHYIDLDRYEVVSPIDTMPHKWDDAVVKYTEDTLKAYGIVPWHIQIVFARLVKAFKENNTQHILKYSADLGHYVADAHVPLHSTINYNGQLTNQHGIHGFWESRLPELFSDQYDFFVGRAVYLDNTLRAAWLASETAFAAKDSVLDFERLLSERMGDDRKFTYEMRGQTKIRTYSKEFSKAYHDMLGDQVERRMKLSVLMVASFWYTAWVNAGQPKLDGKGIKRLSDEELKTLMAEEQKLLYEQKMIGREE